MIAPTAHHPSVIALYPMWVAPPILSAQGTIHLLAAQAPTKGIEPSMIPVSVIRINAG